MTRKELKKLTRRLYSLMSQVDTTSLETKLIDVSSEFRLLSEPSKEGGLAGKSDPKKI